MQQSLCTQSSWYVHNNLFAHITAIVQLSAQIAKLYVPVWGVGIERPLLSAIVFKYFRQFKEKQLQAYFATFASWLYNSYNCTNKPGQHMRQSQGPGPDSKCSKTVEVGCSDHVHVRVKTLSVRDSH